jgi:hypothetical protein
MTEDIRFDRIVVQLSLRPISRSALAFVAELARSLGTEVLAQFQRDESLLNLVEFPGTREFRVLERAWQELAVERIPLDLDLAARTAERLFREASRSSGITGRFEITERPSQPADVARGDILVIYEPEAPIERLGQSLPQLIQSQLSAGTTFLIVPGTIDPRGADVTALSLSPVDPALALARRVAEATGMNPQVMELGASPDIAAIIAHPALARARLIVSTRLLSNGAARLLYDLARLRSVPVLCIGETEPAHADQRC